MKRRHGVEADVHGGVELTNGFFGGDYSLDQRLANIRLRPIAGVGHVRQIRLVGNLQTVQFLSITLHDVADHL